MILTKQTNLLTILTYLRQNEPHNVTNSTKSTNFHTLADENFTPQHNFFIPKRQTPDNARLLSSTLHVHVV